VKSWIILIAASLLQEARGPVGPSPSSVDPALSGYARPQTLVRLPGGRRLHMRCMGTGSPTVILTPGQGDWGLAWRTVQPGIAKRARVCAWDRAGTGFSDSSPKSQDALETTRDLERLLAAGRIRGPYVLVGHSLGAFETLLYAYRHPHRVAGIVLVDPSVPFQYRRFAKVAPEGAAVVQDAAEEEATSLGECIRSTGSRWFKPGSPAFNDCVQKPPANYPPDLAAALVRMDSRVAGARNRLSLMRNWDRSSRQVERARRQLGDMPLVVLTAGRNLILPATMAADAAKIEAEWNRMHDELASLSSAGTNRMVPDAGHYIQNDRPDLVVDEVAAVVEAARGRGAGKGFNAPAVQH
jgi:pimeloyl-ACP methyl ester carboxylesterase